MSKYAHQIQNGTLVVVKQKLITFWRWVFHHSEEDRLNQYKNELVMAKLKTRRLQYLIPKEEDRIKKMKEALTERQGSNGRGPWWRDKWSRRRKPVLLIEEIKFAKKQSKRDPPKRGKPMLEIHQAN